MKRSIQKGFTLIELMIVVAVVGILAAIALPQYQNYMIRARVSQVLSTFDALKTCVGEQFVSTGSLADSIVSGCSAASNAYFPAMTAQFTGITVAGISSAIGAAVSASLSNNYSVSASAAIPANLTWTCTGNPIQYFPAGCRG
jgi:type IV pilus assembly protein PilA